MIIRYSVIGWTDKTKMGDLESYHATMKGALRKIEELKKSGLYEMLTLREEVKYTDCSVETSTPLFGFELQPDGLGSWEEVHYIKI